MTPYLKPYRFFFKNPSFSQYPFVNFFWGGGLVWSVGFQPQKNHKSFLCRLVLRLSGCLYLFSSAVCVAGLTHYSAVCRHRLKACGLDRIGIWDIPDPIFLDFLDLFQVIFALYHGNHHLG